MDRPDRDRAWPRPAGAVGRAAVPLPRLGQPAQPDGRDVGDRCGRLHDGLRAQQRLLHTGLGRQRPLTGGVDQSTIASIRNAGGDVVPSFGGWSGNKLEESCSSAGELANAYQQVIDAYGLSAIDIDLEASAYDNPTVQQRTVDALKTAKSRNPGLHVAITIGTGQQGPDRSLIDRAAASGLTVDAWTIMPFNFGGNGQDMGALSTQAAEGLKSALKSAYGYSDAEAYDRMGISSMNGTTDVGENVTLEDFEQMRGYAEQHGLARLTFWSVNRDPGLDFTRVFAQYGG